MQENTIFVKKYTDPSRIPAVNEREVWRYAGYLGNITTIDEELESQFRAVVKELEKAFSYKVCYRILDLEWKDGMPALPKFDQSKNLAGCLWGSSKVVLFAATIGLEIDRYIARYQRLSPVKALIMQAYGAERIESLCDLFCGELKEEAAGMGLSLSPRYSPGYGDLSLEVQKEMFRLLDCNRQIGVSLNESLLMTPSKSVTAIVGLGECLSDRREHKCENCDKIDCEYRKQEKE